MPVPTTTGLGPFKPAIRYDGTLYVREKLEQEEDLAIQPSLVCCKAIHDATVGILREHGFAPES